jgi:O-acetyl-ADP-ribose deacetylase (regulator of RNase III)
MKPHPKIKLVKGDITRQQVDAIVNAANSSLMGGGGVDGAIHRAGGPAILMECRKIVAKQGGCNTGEAVITTGGWLPARYVIHTVGPVWNDGRYDEEKKLANCYINSLKIAVDYAVGTIAFPNISTGVYHFPKERAAAIAINTVTAFLETGFSIDEIIFVCFDDDNHGLYKTYLQL